MGYALSRIVNIWMGLYVSLPRIRVWARDQNRKPTIYDALNYLATQQYRATDAALYHKMQNMFQRLHDQGCKQAVLTLEKAWTSAVSKNDISFESPIRAISLYDFPRFMGASWPHNDIALYLPDFKKTAVMKLSDSRFQVMKENLKSWSHGMDPFIGTHFTLEHSKLNTAFNRIRASKASPITQDSLHQFPSFKEQIVQMETAYLPASNLRSVLEGETPLDLTNFIIARYGSGYALMQFVQSDVIVKDAVRFHDWNHFMRFEVDGIETSAWMARNALFDPTIDPTRCVGKKIRIGGFVLIGNSVIEDLRARIHLISMSLLGDMLTPAFSVERCDHDLPTIKNVEEEMIELTEKIQKAKADELKIENEIQQEIVDEEEPTLIPKIVEIRESDLPREEGRILVLLASNRMRYFYKNEILTRLAHEGLRTSSSIATKSLEELCKKEYAYMNIFGDAWFANPALRVIPSPTKVVHESVAPRIAEYLKKAYPRKINRVEIIQNFLHGDSRLTSTSINKALNILSREKIIYHNKNRYVWNPDPPRRTPRISEPEQNEDDRISLVQLDERQIEKIPGYLHVSEQGWVNIYKNNAIVKKILVRRQESRSTLEQLIDYLRKGTYTSIDFEDHRGGFVKIMTRNGKLQGVYTAMSMNLNRQITSLR